MLRLFKAILGWIDGADVPAADEYEAMLADLRAQKFARIVAERSR